MWFRQFIYIWTGQLFSTISSQVVTFSIIFWLSIKMNSAEVLALSTLSSMLPQLILGFFTGVLIDRWNRKLTMIIADLYIAFVTLLLIIIITLGELQIGYLYAMLALRSIGSAFHVPAMEASVPLLAPKDKLMKVAGVDNIIFSISTIASPALAAFMISIMKIESVLWFDIIGAIIACVSLLFVKIPNHRADTQEKSEESEESEESEKPHTMSKFFTELKQGVEEVLKIRGLLWLFIFTIFASIALVPISSLFPLMTLNHFSGNTYMMSIVEISWGIGMLAGGGIMSLSWFKFNKINIIHICYIIIGITYALSGILPTTSFGFNIFVFLTALGGVGGAIFFGTFTVLLQSSLHSGVLGRVFSIHNSFIMIPAMFSLIATGYIADTIGLERTFIISGAILIFIGIFAPSIPHIRSFKSAVN